MNPDYVKILRCPNSGCTRSEKEPLRGSLHLINARFKDGLIRTGTLKCSTCGEEFPIKSGFSNLLPERIRKCLEGEPSEEKLTPYDKEILNGIRWSGRMVPSYHANVVDPFTSALGARYIERYEDLYIDNMLNKYIKNRKMKVIFIEMGVGTGRYLIRYGSRLLNNEVTFKEKIFIKPFKRPLLKSKVCQAYREDSILRKYYSYDIDYDQNLQLLIGIDFQESMIEKCIDNLREMKLHSLFGKRILLSVGTAQYFNLALDQIDEFKNSFRVVTCVFQTLGNQKEKLQIDLLKTLHRLASPQGIIVVSVFNKERFSEFGLESFYKYEVAPTVGEMRDDSEALELRRKGILVTRQGVYSQWFSKEDLKKVFNAAGLNVTLKSYDQLGPFGDTNYIGGKKQEEVRKTLIIAESEV